MLGSVGCAPTVANKSIVSSLVLGCLPQPFRSRAYMRCMYRCRSAPKIVQLVISLLGVSPLVCLGPLLAMCSHKQLRLTSLVGQLLRPVQPEEAGSPSVSLPCMSPEFKMVGPLASIARAHQPAKSDRGEWGRQTGEGERKSGALAESGEVRPAAHPPGEVTPTGRPLLAAPSKPSGACRKRLARGARSAGAHIFRPAPPPV